MRRFTASKSTSLRTVRAFLGISAAALAAGACADAPQHDTPAAPAAAEVAPERGARRPNIILILSDDQDAASFQYMDVLQRRLAAEGTTFDNFFVTNPVCCPSRASFLTGLYSHNHRVLTNVAPFGGFAAYGMEQRSLPVWLNDAGYRTAMMGKYLNGYDELAPAYVPPGWDSWAVLTAYFGRTTNMDGMVQPFAAPEGYSTDRLSRLAAGFIGDAVQREEPFFLYLAPFAPHAPSKPAPRHAGMAAGLQAPRRPSFNELDTSDKPPLLASRPLLTEADIADIDELYRRRVETLYAVDELIEALIDSLAALGVLDDTYIFYTSDNGFHLGEHRLPPGKNSPYEEDIRLPLIVRGPGVQAGVTRDEFVVNHDLASTILELAGIRGITTDGTSFAGMLRGESGPERNRVLVEKWLPDGSLTWQAVRTRRYTFVLHTSGERQLYDLWTDPYQLDNIARSAPPRLLARLTASIRQLSACSGRSCRTAEFAPE